MNVSVFFLLIVVATIVLASSATFISADLASLRTLLNNREAALGRIVDKTQTAANQRCGTLSGWSSSSKCVYPGCGSNFPSDSASNFTCQSDFGLETDVCGASCSGLVRSTTRSTTLFSPRTDLSNKQFQSFVSMVPEVETAMKKELDDGNTNAWMGIGFQESGSSSWFPGNPYERGTTCSFETTQRPWFVAGSSGPKNVVFVIDLSGSMSIRDGSKTRLQLVKDAMGPLLKTLGPSDFFSVVTFASGASKIMGSTLIRATNGNIELATSRVNGWSAGGGTNFPNALRAAFEILIASTSAGVNHCGCTNSDIIIMLSDGATQSRSSVMPTISSYQNQMPSGRRAKVVTAAMSCAADRSMLREMACGHKGIALSIVDGENPLGKLSQYFKLLAFGLNSSHPVWVNSYTDAFGMGKMTSVARSIFDKSTPSIPLFLGVAELDVKWADLQAHGLTDAQIEEELQTRSGVCSNNDEISTCYLQLLREEAGYQCPGVTSVEKCRTSVSDFQELQVCTAGPARGANALLCEDVSPTRYVAINSPKNSAEVMCCSGCVTKAPVATSLAEIPTSPPKKCSAGKVGTISVSFFVLILIVLCMSTFF